MPQWIEHHPNREDYEPIKVRRALREEMPGLLANKIVEEASELSSAMSDFKMGQGCNDDHIVEEIADVIETLIGIAIHLDIPDQRIQNAMQKKRSERGSFLKGIVKVFHE